jgi:hypothetical protein
MTSIICDTGPLIGLSLVEQLDVLPQLYSSVLMPAAVLTELTAGGEERSGVAVVLAARWLERTAQVEVDPLLAAELGTGEAAVIATAHRRPVDVVLLDDRRARRIAVQAYRLRVQGTAGLLVAAKHVGLLPAVRPLLEAMREQGYHLSQRLIDRAAAEAGEP